MDIKKKKKLNKIVLYSLKLNIFIVLTEDTQDKF